MRLRECERQIASAVAVAAVAAIAVAVVIVNGVGVNGCVPSASTPEVHVLPGRGRRCRARGGCGVFPRGRRRHQNDKDLEALASTNDPRSSTNTLGHQTNNPRWDETTLLYQCNVCNYLVDALVPTFNFSTLLVFKSPTGPRLLLNSTALHCSAGCRPTPTTKDSARCGRG
jgi:hypothetical protein